MYLALHLQQDPGESRVVLREERRGTKMALKRERVDTRGGDRYVRRDEHGRFTSDQASVGCSLSQDRRRDAKTEVPSGQGDRGDQKRR